MRRAGSVTNGKKIKAKSGLGNAEPSCAQSAFEWPLAAGLSGARDTARRGTWGEFGLLQDLAAVDYGDTAAHPQNLPWR